MFMTIVNIHEVKARLSHYLAAVERGERVIISNRNRPVAELRAIAEPPTGPRPVGGAVGQVEVLDAFFDPLPDEFVDPFTVNTLEWPSEVAERPARQRVSAKSRGKKRSR